MSRRRFFLITNPGAGLTGSPLVDAVANALLCAGAELTLTQPGDIDTARRQVREAARSGRYDAILAAGGDGTIRQVAATLIGTEAPLGIVPVGTGNVLAHEIGLAPQANAIADMLLRGPVIHAVCARANDEPFLLMAGAGFDGRVIAALDHRLKSHVGKAAYAGADDRGAGPSRRYAHRHGRRHGARGELGGDLERAPLRRQLRHGPAHRHPRARAAGHPVQGQEPGRSWWAN